MLIDLPRLGRAALRRGGPQVAAISAVLAARGSWAQLERAVKRHSEALGSMDVDVLLALLTELRLEEAKEYLRKTIVYDGKEKRADMCKAFEELKKDINEKVKAAKEEAKVAKEEAKAAREEAKAAKKEAKSQKVKDIYIFIGAMMRTGQKNADIVKLMASSYMFSEATARRYLNGYNRLVADGGETFTPGTYMA